MKATLIESSYNGSKIKGDAVMLSKYGEIYNTIDNAYHPNPGGKIDGYSEIERCIDWLVANDLLAVKKDILEWMKCRIALVIDEDIEEIIHDVMYDDLYELNEKTRALILEAYNEIVNDDITIDRYIDTNEIDAAEKIATYINETFLRIRAGGKLNPDGSDSIYFRISSHGYDWHRNIVEFLWEVFGDLKKMPHRIVICHDAETNPPEVILFDGTPEDLFEHFDTKKFEAFQRNIQKIKESKINNDRKAFKINSNYYLSEIEGEDSYKIFS